MTGTERDWDDAATLRLYAAMLRVAESDARRYRLAWLSARRRAAEGHDLRRRATAMRTFLKQLR